jgi:hypothetical protein
MKPRSAAMAITVVLLSATALTGCSRPAGESSESSAAGPTTAQVSFVTPDEAVGALLDGLEKGDVPALQKVLGPGSAALLSSGDAIADQRERETFLARYRAHHELEAGDPNDLVLMVGDDRWPLPMPLVQRNGRWSFDGAAGAEELVYRRIGANELHTIEVMRGFVEAQSDYASAGHDGAEPGVFAQKLRSDPGRQDGLYWEVAAGQDPSPAGSLLAAAQSEGYGNTQAGATPYHGYLYRTLDAQGPAANGGARDYLVNGKLTGGFALLAYPATYGVSGVMTFMVSQDGIVWQRNLGDDTAKAATAIQQFNPDDSWTPLAPEG